MKKSVTLLFSVVLMSLVGCQRNGDEPLLKSDYPVFTASTEVFTPTSKTSLTPERAVVWSADDRVAIFQGSSIADEYVIAQSSVGKTNATLTILKDNGVENGDFSAGVKLPGNVAYYPYSSELALSGSAFDDEVVYRLEGVLLPEVQTYASKSFANGAFPMVAVTQAKPDHNLKFKNVLGAIKLQLKGTQKIQSVKIEGADGEKLSGAASVTAYSDNSVPSIIMSSDANRSVILDCGDGVQLDQYMATDFIIALPPTEFNNGFYIEVTDSNDRKVVFTARSANTVYRSSILVMPAVVVPDNMNGGTEDVNKGEDVGINK